MPGQPAQSLNEQVQRSVTDSVERLYDETLRSLASQIQDARSSLENASQQLPDSKESQDRLREMQRTFEELEETRQRSGAKTGGATSDTLGVDEQDIPEESRPATGQVTDVLQSGGLLGGPQTTRASPCSAP